MTRAYLSLGSNMGDKRTYLDEALNLLKGHGEITINKVSSYYETQPVGYTNQDLFLNTVVEIETKLEPYPLLNYCNEIEEKLDRKRTIRWGPRTIDIDMLLYEGFESKEEKLTVPHPRMTERAFVMVPLLEINEDITINSQPIKELMKAISLEGITKVFDRPYP